MNKTRILWSNQLHCCGGRDSSRMIFFTLASAAITIILTFYLAVFVYEKRVEHRSILIANDSPESPHAEPNDLSKPSTSNEAIKRRNRRTNSESSDDMNDDGDGPIHNQNLINI